MNMGFGYYRGRKSCQCHFEAMLWHPIPQLGFKGQGLGLKVLDKTFGNNFEVSRLTPAKK